jgi:hypothetical protein
MNKFTFFYLIFYFVNGFIKNYKNNLFSHKIIPMYITLDGIIKSFVAPITLGKSSGSASEQALLGTTEISNEKIFPISAGVFRTLQQPSVSPAAPHPGQALLGAAEKAIGNWKLLYTDNNIFYQKNIIKKEIINYNKHFILYDNHNEYNKIELNIYPDYENKLDLTLTNMQNNLTNLQKETIILNNTFPKLILTIKKYEKQNLITYSKIINCNLFLDSYKENNEYCSLLILTSEKMIKSFGIFEFPHLTFLYKSAMNSTYAITWKIDTQLNRLYVYFDKNTYVFEREFYDEMIMNKQSITTNTFIVTNIISFIMCKLLEKIFNGE